MNGVRIFLWGIILLIISITPATAIQLQDYNHEPGSLEKNIIPSHEPGSLEKNIIGNISKRTIGGLEYSYLSYYDDHDYILPPNPWIGWIIAGTAIIIGGVVTVATGGTAGPIFIAISSNLSGFLSTAAAGWVALAILGAIDGAISAFASTLVTDLALGVPAKQLFKNLLTNTAIGAGVGAGVGAIMGGISRGFTIWADRSIKEGLIADSSDAFNKITTNFPPLRAAKIIESIESANPYKAAQIISELDPYKAVKIINEMNLAKAMRIIEKMDSDHVGFIMSNMDVVKAGMVINEINEVTLLRIFNAVTPSQGAKLLSNIDPSKAAQIIRGMYTPNGVRIFNKMDLSKVTDIMNRVKGLDPSKAGRMTSALELLPLKGSNSFEHWGNEYSDEQMRIIEEMGSGEQMRIIEPIEPF